MDKIRPYSHPGEILKEEFIKPLNLTQAKIANDLNIDLKTINEICTEKRGISPVMALKLSNYFGTTSEFWINLQSNYDLYKAYEKEKISIEQVKPLVA